MNKKLEDLGNKLCVRTVILDTKERIIVQLTSA